MQSNFFSLSKAFAPESSPQYIMPLFQRAFEWKKDQFLNLWEDILTVTEQYYLAEDEEQAKKITHFLGVIISCTENKNAPLVIDGQQRLTTVSIFFKAASDFCENNKISFEGEYSELEILIPKFYKRNQPLGRGKFKNESERLKIKHGLKDFKTYQQVVMGGSRPFKTIARDVPNYSKNIKGCYDFFYKKFTEIYQSKNSPEWADAENVIQKILIVFSEQFKCCILDFSESELDSVAFSNLNGGGVELTTVDLLKSVLLKSDIESAYPNEEILEGHAGSTLARTKIEELHKKYWEPFEAAIPNEKKKSEFFLIYAQSLYKKISKSAVYTTIKLISKHRDEKFFDNFSAFYKAYSFCNEGKVNKMLIDDGKGHRRLTEYEETLIEKYCNFKELGEQLFKQITTLLIYKLLNNELSTEDFETSLKLVSFVLIRAYLLDNTGQINSKISEYLCKIYENKFEDIPKELEQFIQISGKNSKNSNLTLTNSEDLWNQFNSSGSAVSNDLEEDVEEFKARCAKIRSLVQTIFIESSFSEYILSLSPKKMQPETSRPSIKDGSKVFVYFKTPGNPEGIPKNLEIVSYPIAPRDQESGIIKIYGGSPEGELLMGLQEDDEETVSLAGVRGKIRIFKIT